MFLSEDGLQVVLPVVVPVFSGACAGQRADWGRLYILRRKLIGLKV